MRGVLDCLSDRVQSIVPSRLLPGWSQIHGGSGASGTHCGSETYLLSGGATGFTTGARDRRC